MMDDTISIQQLHDISGVGVRTLQLRATRENWPCIELSGKGRGGKVRRFKVDGLPDEMRLLYNKVQLLPATQSPGDDLPIKKDHTLSPSCLTDKQRQVGGAKIDLVRHYLQAIKRQGHGKKGAARDDFVLAYNSGFVFPELYRTLGPVSWKTIEGWKRTLRNGGDMSALADRRGKWRRGKTIVTAQQAGILLQCALHPNRWLISEVIRIAKQRMLDAGIDNGHSEATYRRWLMDFKEHNFDIWCWQRGGEKRWSDDCALAIERNPDLINVGDVLVADGHKLNFEIINPLTGKPQRMTLIMFYDMRSNYPCGWEIMPTENIAAISAALRRAILILGKIPRVVYLDNGRAFKAKCFTADIDLEQSGCAGLYAQLGIQTVFAWPYHGQSKTVERFFKTFAELERYCPTYVGTGIDAKPPRMMRGEKMHRRIYEKVMSGQCLTLEMAHRAVAAWFDEYASRPQPGSKYLNGYAPIDLFGAGRGPGVDPIELTYLMWSKKDAFIRNSRISFGGRYYYHRDLESRRHKVEIRYDPQDPTYIAVFEDGELLCLAAEQETVHPMAILGTQADRDKLADFCELKNSQKKRASQLSRHLLETEVLPAHLRQLEMDGVTAHGPIADAEPEPKKLTAVDEKRIINEVAQYKKTKQSEQSNIWTAIEKLPEADRYEQLVRHSARGTLIPREHAAWMRYFEQTNKYAQLERTGYWENVRTAENLMRRKHATVNQ